jgi:hypothetical protein
MKKYKYTATRCDSINGEDIESKEFLTKAQAVAWVKFCKHGRVRKYDNDRTIVFSKGF